MVSPHPPPLLLPSFLPSLPLRRSHRHYQFLAKKCRPSSAAFSRQWKMPSSYHLCRAPLLRCMSLWTTAWKACLGSITSPSLVKAPSLPPQQTQHWVHGSGTYRSNRSDLSSRPLTRLQKCRLIRPLTCPLVQTSCSSSSTMRSRRSREYSLMRISSTSTRRNMQGKEAKLLCRGLNSYDCLPPGNFLYGSSRQEV